MIRNVTFNSMHIQAGQDIELTVDAYYPIKIIIKCFITDPPPTRYADCEDAGIHVLNFKQTFSFPTSARTFEKLGEIEFVIEDAERDTKLYKVKVENKNTSGRTPLLA